ncbi:hypothetical protein BX666DRAFT_2037613 [Dichotomocladium elegans]|nr:hypothetical protein BX666DRAFT_2037613 [Dichotomocladium elegans]
MYSSASNAWPGTLRAFRPRGTNEVEYAADNLDWAMVNYTHGFDPTLQTVAKTIRKLQIPDLKTFSCALSPNRVVELDCRYIDDYFSGFNVLEGFTMLRSVTIFAADPTSYPDLPALTLVSLSCYDAAPVNDFRSLFFTHVEHIKMSDCVMSLDLLVKIIRHCTRLRSVDIYRVNQLEDDYYAGGNDDNDNDDDEEKENAIWKVTTEDFLNLMYDVNYERSARENLDELKQLCREKGIALNVIQKPFYYEC